jgi:ABC-type transport system involved in multi-copper enzyme maturation permease subunit
VKYLSILQDSFREARDSKLLYVTVGLSLVLILLLASTSFRPVSMQEEVEGMASQMQFLFRLQAQANPQGGELSCTVPDFEQLNQAAQPWDGDYRFTVALHFPTEGLAKGPGKEMARALRLVVFGRLWWLKDPSLRDSWSADHRTFRLTVTNHGTQIHGQRAWVHEPTALFGLFPLRWFRTSLTYAVYWIENRLVNTVGGWVIVLLGVVVTASFLPNMLRKGTVDLLLSKPVTRPGLLLVKYVGGLTFLFLNTVVAIGGVWLVLGLRAGVWTWSFPVTALILTFFFAILYAVSTLFAVLTRSTVVCILLTLVVWAVLFGVGFAYNTLHPPSGPSGIEALLAEEGTGAARREEAPDTAGLLVRAVDVVHAVLPRTGDLGALSTQLISQELLSPAERSMFGFEQAARVNWVESVGVSAGFIAVMLGLSCWAFARKDY